MSNVTEPRPSVETKSAGAVPAAPASERDQARKRLEMRHKFQGDVAAYVVVNLFLVGIWAVSGFGYFWPGWVLAGWGLLLTLDAWNIYFRRPITEHDIDEEMRRAR